MEKETTTAVSGFSQLGISSRVAALLEKRKFTTPTPIQQQAIPAASQGQDVIGIAQTGTGKTFAFGLPMMDRLISQNGTGLVIVPTRELALQVEESIRPFANELNIRTAVLIGGASMNIQLQILRKGPRIIIATPGRLIDHMERFRLSLKEVSVLVLDEADRMLDMGFAPQIKRILESVPKERQTMLFSATMPDDIVNIAKRHMQTPVRIEVAPAGTTNSQVQQELFFVHRDDKPSLLNSLLNTNPGTAIVFTRTKHGATKVNKLVASFGIKSDEIHSNRSLAQRKRALSDFKTGRIRVLVATDIAARGIDVKDISTVINYDIPENADDYVHRIGRTGRAGAQGKAITFAMPDQRGDVRDIERLIRQAIAIGQMPAGIKDPGVSKLSGDSRDSGGPRKRFQHRDRNFGRPEGQSRRQAAGGSFSRGGRGMFDPSAAPKGRRPAYGSSRPAYGAGRPQAPRAGGGERSYGKPRSTGGRSYGNSRPSGGAGGYGGRRSGGSSARAGGAPNGRSRERTR